MNEPQDINTLLTALIFVIIIGIAGVAVMLANALDKLNEILRRLKGGGDEDE